MAFSSDKGIYWKSADGTGTEERLTTGGLASSWSPNGPTLAFLRAGDIWTLPISGDRQPHQVAETPSAEEQAEFSPDGRWLAYTSNESGRDEVYVQAYPGPGPKHQVSVDGGIAPAWSRHGREIVYQVRSAKPGELTERRTFMSVPVTIKGRTFVADRPKALFELPYPQTALPVREYDVTPDGRRCLVVQDSGRPPTRVTEMILVQNWVEELKRRVPTR